jgi:HD-GYP domain-containing protein (c-di-GMP phosphodiesterase class II)
LYVPAEILTRPGYLSETEFELIKSHAEVGYEILKNIEFHWPVPLIVRQHHERLDGSGYPAGLKGDDILFEARILGVADVVEAMSSHRPYRPGKGVESALEELRSSRGTAYDPSVVDACLKLFRNGFCFVEVPPLTPRR